MAKKISKRKLAQLLGIKPSAVSMWKTYNSIPMKHIMKFQQLMNLETIDDAYSEIRRIVFGEPTHEIVLKPVESTTGDEWIRLPKELQEWEWYSNSHMVRLFIHLLLSASHEPIKWNDIVIERGQVVTNKKELSETLGIPEQAIRNCLYRLKSDGEIAITPTDRYSIITICEYWKYQLGEDKTDQQADQQSIQQMTVNQI